MQAHFSRVAYAYRGLRTTDIEPILYIKENLGNQGLLRAADIACGAGRYDLLLLQHLSISHLLCVDANVDMLKEARNHLTETGARNFHALVTRTESLPIRKNSLDCLFTFNAVHHFDFDAFLHQAEASLVNGGRMFIYTRLPDQNEASIWGKYFPGFNEKETRLFELANMEKGIAQMKNLALEEVKFFRYRRVSSLDKLLLQVREKHYSTFSLYAPQELERAMEEFKENVRSHFFDSDRVHWLDGNLMLVLRRVSS